MSIYGAMVITTTIYKLACLAVGLLLCHMGYQLFIKGIWGNAGDVDARYGSTKLVLKQGAPGTFFAVLGAGIIVATIVMGLGFKMTRETGGTDEPENRSANQGTDDGKPSIPVAPSQSTPR